MFVRVFVSFACVGVVCYVCDVVQNMCTSNCSRMRPCCTHRNRAWVRPTSPAKSSIRFASQRTRNLAGKTEKRGTVGAFGKAGGVDRICIPLMMDVDPTAIKLYLSDISPHVCSDFMIGQRISDKRSEVLTAEASIGCSSSAYVLWSNMNYYHLIRFTEDIYYSTIVYHLFYCFQR